MPELWQEPLGLKTGSGYKKRNNEMPAMPEDHRDQCEPVSQISTNKLILAHFVLGGRDEKRT